MIRNNKRSHLYDIDKESQQFQRIKEEYHSTLIREFMIKYTICSWWALALFWKKTANHKYPPRWKSKTVYTPKFNWTLEVSAPKIKNQDINLNYNYYNKKWFEVVLNQKSMKI